MPRPDMAEGCPERVNLEFPRFIWTFRRARRPGILRRLREMPPGRTVVRPRSSAAAEAFLARSGAGAAAAGPA